MSELHQAVELLEMAKNIIGQKGPVEIDSGIYSHNFDMEDKEKDDICILGQAGEDITSEQLIELITKLGDLADDLEDDTGRSYRFEGVNKESENKYRIMWGS